MLHADYSQVRFNQLLNNNRWQWYVAYLLALISEKDLCEGQVVKTSDKGDILLLDTEVGLRRAVRCPYAIMDPVYATADCIACNWSAQWSQLKYDLCPDPPFTVAVQELYNYVTATTVGID
jgi:hypothetical protein